MCEAHTFALLGRSGGRKTCRPADQAQALGIFSGDQAVGARDEYGDKHFALAIGAR